MTLHRPGYVHLGARVWTDGVWPVTTGALTAAGVLGALTAYGLLGLSVVYVFLSIFLSMVVFGLAHEMGVGTRSAVRWGLGSALAVVVAIGLCLQFGYVGMLAATMAGATSPLAFGLLALLGRRRAKAPAAPPPSPRLLLDTMMVDREFDEIAALIQEPDQPSE
jgi:hypothetical protein